MDQVDKIAIPDEPEGGAKDSISRRDALKRMAKIALGVGAASILPSVLASCYTDYSDYSDSYSNSYSDSSGYYSDYNNYSDYYSPYDAYGY